MLEAVNGNARRNPLSATMLDDLSACTAVVARLSLSLDGTLIPDAEPRHRCLVSGGDRAYSLHCLNV